MPDQEDIRPVALTVSGKTLALITGGGLLLGALIVVGAVMPAEFNTDPLGIGKASGISRLWAPEEKDFAGSGALATSSDAPKQSHIVDIPLGAADWKEAAIEYKVAMKPGQSIFYKWTATNLDGSPATVPVETDQHGHDLPAEGQPQTVIDYRKARLVFQESQPRPHHDPPRNRGFLHAGPPRPARQRVLDPTLRPECRRRARRTAGRPVAKPPRATISR